MLETVIVVLATVIICALWVGVLALRAFRQGTILSEKAGQPPVPPGVLARTVLLCGGAAIVIGVFAWYWLFA